MMNKQGGHNDRLFFFCRSKQKGGAGCPPYSKNGLPFAMLAFPEIFFGVNEHNKSAVRKIVLVFGCYLGVI